MVNFGIRLRTTSQNSLALRDHMDLQRYFGQIQDTVCYTVASLPSPLKPDIGMSSINEIGHMMDLPIRRQ
jgi:hypothetical protein